MFAYVNRKKYKTVSAALAFAKVTFDRMVMNFFYIEFVIFSLFAIAYPVCSWIIAIFKECKYDKRRHPTVYMFISCILMSQNCIRSGKSCKMYAISIQCFQVQMFLFYISKLNNAICWECLAYTIDMLYYLFLQYLT